MAPHEHEGSRLFGRLFNFANNPVTLAGAALTTVSAVLIITFLIVNLFGGMHDNPYVGMFAYVVLPFFFVVGLIAIPVGMLWRRRRLARAGTSEEDISEYPRLDFNDPKMRRVATIFLVLTAINAVILGASSFLAIEHTESVEFCGETCHTVMQPEFAAYQNSPHSRVACVECHIGPGASWFVRSKLDGVKQVWHTALDTYHRPIASPIKDLRPARETCEQCHWPNKHHGDKLRVFARYRADEQNTPSYTAMLLKTGGGSLDLGTHGGIHWWHIYSDNRIRYVAGDERREEIIWVELTTPEGEVRVYTRNGGDLPPPNELEANARIMDCIDCHNRPTHLFQTPAKSIDGVLETYPEFRDLPYYKREAVKAIEDTYPSHAEGVIAVKERLIEFYKEDYPELWSQDSDLVTSAADVASRVYGRTVFPSMGTNWETHPNHIGHDDYPGCWRCHDDELSTADGEHAIPMECENCHVFLVEDAPEPPDLAMLINAS
jgi:nitrate/TMAO reductase-like tetraheme cytochrome c subunit